jgi:hypothetical protein
MTRSNLKLKYLSFLVRVSISEPDFEMITIDLIIHTLKNIFLNPYLAILVPAILKAYYLEPLLSRSANGSQEYLLS